MFYKSDGITLPPGRNKAILLKKESGRRQKANAPFSSCIVVINIIMKIKTASLSSEKQPNRFTFFRMDKKIIIKSKEKVNTHVQKKIEIT